jgi:hypothetical protein
MIFVKIKKRGKTEKDPNKESFYDVILKLI